MEIRIYKTEKRARKYYNSCKDFELLNPCSIEYDKDIKKWVVRTLK